MLKFTKRLNEKQTHFVSTPKNLFKLYQFIRKHLSDVLCSVEVGICMNYIFEYVKKKV